MESIQQQLQQLLNDEYHSLETLYTVLLSEQDSLKRRDIEAINQTLQTKLDLLDKLAGLDEIRKKLLSQNDTENKRDAFVALLQTHTPQLIPTWQKVEENVQRCRHQHQINTRLLEIGNRQVRKMLSALLGNRFGSSVNLYDKKGATAANLTTHTYLKA